MIVRTIHFFFFQVIKFIQEWDKSFQERHFRICYDFNQQIHEPAAEVVVHHILRRRANRHAVDERQVSLPLKTKVFWGMGFLVCSS